MIVQYRIHQSMVAKDREFTDTKRRNPDYPELKAPFFEGAFLTFYLFSLFYRKLKSGRP
jgi:hypothetical protein